MGRQLTGLTLLGVGYAVWYWAFNILMSAYVHQGSSPMNPVPLSVCLGLNQVPRINQDAPIDPNTGLPKPVRPPGVPIIPGA